MQQGDRCPHGILYPHECKPCADFHWARRPFPILIGGLRDSRCPKFIRWNALDDAQAFMNHGQSLERLAERGGLSPCEAIAIIEKRRWHWMDWELALAKILPFACSQSDRSTK